MSIPFLIGLLAVLVTAPLLTHSVFQSAYDWERRQIAVDNAAIVLGERDAATLSALAAGNRLLSGLEVVHHAFHFCALIPETMAECEPKDIALEERIDDIHSSLHRIASAHWRASAAAAIAEQTALGVVPLPVKWRSVSVPIEGRRCSFCGREPYWELRGGSERPKALVHAENSVPVQAAVELLGGPLIKGTGWTYRLSDPSIGGRR